MLRQALGLDMTHVPYKGALPALNDVMGGHVTMMFTPIANALSMIQAGKVRAIGIAASTRVEALPDVPPLAETADLPQYDVAAWIGYAAPAGTPREVLVRLSSEITKALQSEELKERMANIGLDPVATTPEEMAAFMRREQDRYGQIIRSANIKIE